jgi:hypothetical protein
MLDDAMAWNDNSQRVLTIRSDYCPGSERLANQRGDLTISSRLAIRNAEKLPQTARRNGVPRTSSGAEKFFLKYYEIFI